MFKTISEIKDRNAEIGHNWFSRGTMSFFRSRIAPGVYPIPDGALFITSEQYDDNSPRKYTVRRAHDNGNISTVGEFQAYRFLEDARDAAKDLVKEIRAGRQNPARGQSKRKGAASRSIVRRNPAVRHYEEAEWLDFLCAPGKPTADLREYAAEFEQAVASFMHAHRDNEVASRLTKADAAYLTYQSIVGAGTGLWDEEPDGDALDKLVEQDAGLVRMAQRLDEDISDCRESQENPSKGVRAEQGVSKSDLRAYATMIFDQLDAVMQKYNTKKVTDWNKVYNNCKLSGLGNSFSAEIAHEYHEYRSGNVTRGNAINRLVDARLARLKKNPAMSVPVKAAIGVGILAAVGGAAWYLTREKKDA